LMSFVVNPFKCWTTKS